MFSFVAIGVEVAQAGMTRQQLVESGLPLPGAAEPPEQIERRQRLDPRHVLAPGELCLMVFSPRSDRPYRRKNIPHAGDASNGERCWGPLAWDQAIWQEVDQED